MPGQELVQTPVRQVGHAVEDVGESGLGIDVVQLPLVDQDVHRRSPLAVSIRIVVGWKP